MEADQKPMTPSKAVAKIAGHLGETAEAVKAAHQATTQMVASFQGVIGDIAARRLPTLEPLTAAVDAHSQATDAIVEAFTAASDWTKRLHAFEVQREAADRERLGTRRDSIGSARRTFVSDVAGRIARAELKNLEPRLKHGDTPEGKQQLIDWTTGYFATADGKGWTYARRAVSPVVGEEHASEMADEIGRDLITMLRHESAPDELKEYLSDCRADWIETALIGQLYEQCRPAAA